MAFVMIVFSTYHMYTYTCTQTHTHINMFTSFADQTLILCMGGRERGVETILVTVDRFMYALPEYRQQSDCSICVVL